MSLATAAVAKYRERTDLADRARVEREASPKLVAGRVDMVARLAKGAFHLLQRQCQLLGAVFLEMTELPAFCATETRRAAE
jgi:hypothetical protein